jgi:NADP-dependent 3-hydroxy acid dehydrogenase YdfG
MGKLQGKIAWVTGAGTGIGEASAMALAASGAHLVLSGRTEATLQKVASGIVSQGGSAEVAVLDVLDAARTKNIASDLKARLGGVDIFMANAGLNTPIRHTDTLTTEEFDKVVGINLNGVMYGILAVLPHMRDKGAGTLILNSSWAGRHPTGMTGAAYNAAKYAVVALGHTINAENGMRNIRCTVLMPGGVATPIWQASKNPPTAERLANMLQSEDVGDFVRYIAEAPPNVCFNEVVIAPTRNRVIAV